MAILEEYLKRKLFAVLDTEIKRKVGFLFLPDSTKASRVNKTGKRLVFNEPLNPNFTVNDVCRPSDKKKKAIKLSFRIVFENETVYPELCKKMPNHDIISQSMSKRISKKIKKKRAINQAHNRTQNNKSMFSLFNNSKNFGDALADFPGTNRLDTINHDKFPFNDSNNFFASKKDSINFLKVSNIPKKDKSNNTEPNNFKNIANIIKNNEIKITKIDPSKIKNIENKSDRGNSIKISLKNGNKDSSIESKGSEKYNDNVNFLYNKIKEFN